MNLITTTTENNQKQTRRVLANSQALFGRSAARRINGKIRAGLRDGIRDLFRSIRN